ncbi:hypothetical protein D3C85_1799440 [compost metagenome]
MHVTGLLVKAALMVTWEAALVAEVEARVDTTKLKAAAVFNLKLIANRWYTLIHEIRHLPEANRPHLV